MLLCSAWPEAECPAGEIGVGQSKLWLQDRASFGYKLRKKALAIGPALSAPRPPPSTSTAKATSPRWPMNQPWDGGFGPFPYCAVPVLP